MANDDISALIKYCDTATALKILNSQSLRWSASDLFHDPFELRADSDPALDSEKVLRGLIKQAVGMLFGPTELAGKSNKLVAAIARWRDEERFDSEEEAEGVLRQLLGQVAEQQQDKYQKLIASWQQFARNTRVCCFASKPDNNSCWQHYGDNHEGIALKFSCGPDTALSSPKRVSYSPTPPRVTSLKQQVAICYGHDSDPRPSDFLQLLLSKNKAQSDEREWRCFGSETTEAGSDPQLWYSSKKFSAPELKAVYFGLATPAATKKTVLQLLRDNYKSTKVFQAQASANSYDIEFVAQA